jgi:hypothetical protein
MNAKVGDRLVISGHHVGEHEREAQILEVRGAAGAPPYLVRWVDDGHVSLLHPGPDALVQHVKRTRTTSSKRGAREP